MTATIINAAPMVVSKGIQDLSTRTLPQVPDVLPTHLPKIYLYTQQGPTEPQLVSGDSATQIYGSASFDLRQPWATHATALFNTVNAQGNAIMVERVEPVDAAPPACMRVYLDVLPTTVTVYARNSDGSITMDGSGNPVPATPAQTTAGYKVKWVVVPIPTTGAGAGFGAGTIVAGDQTDSVSDTQSQRYPIYDTVVSSFGAYGNNLGLRIWAPTMESSQPMDPTLLAQQVYPIRMACVSRATAASSAVAVPTLTGAFYIDGCLKPNTINNNTDSLVYLGNTFVPSYTDTTSEGVSPIYGPFGQFKVYDANIQSLLTEFYNAEKTFFNGFSDMTGVGVSEMYLFNFLGGVSSQNVPYTSFQIVTGASNSSIMAPNSNLWASGGSDGTMSEALFGPLVGQLIQEYADPLSVYQDQSTYPESIFYDSGFPTAVKQQLVAFIALRKDLFIVLSTHDVLSAQLTAAEESSLAIALQTYLQQYPESDFFGTPTVRGMIIGRSGTCTAQPMYTKPLPLTFEIANKAATYMGAGNGIWKAGFSFDHLPNSAVTMFQDINVTFTPATVRNQDWANGLNWVQAYQRRGYFFPALKTVYNNDTSVLTSFFTAMICVELEKVGYRAWQEYSGESSLTDAQLLDRVNAYVTANTTGRFDGRVTIIPNAYYTADDQARGYSWTLAIQVYAAVEKTVQTLIVQSFRNEDLPTS